MLQYNFGIIIITAKTYRNHTPYTNAEVVVEMVTSVIFCKRVRILDVFAECWYVLGFGIILITQHIIVITRVGYSERTKLPGKLA